MTIMAGMDWGGDEMSWPCPGPHDPARNCPDMPGYGWRSGLHIWGNGFSNIDIRDHFSYGNAGDGISLGMSSSTNIDLIRATVANNALASDEDGVDMTAASLAQVDTFTDSYIEGTAYQGSGAQLTYRYESSFDGDTPSPNLTDTALWPWPMEYRINSEFATYLYPTFGDRSSSDRRLFCDRHDAGDLRHPWGPQSQSDRV